MSGIGDAFLMALDLVVSLDADFVAIVLRSLFVSLAAVLLAGLVGLPLGAAIAVWRFPGRGAVIVALNALMGLPPVFVGLMIYMMLSRSGPLGFLGLLFTPGAMIVAQFVLVLPIVAALAHQAMRPLYEEYQELLCSLGARPHRAVATLLLDARLALLTVLMAGFGRAAAEVGAVLIVGGNIDHVTRVMTTTIALETSRGNLALALALGLVLVALALAVNALVFSLGRAVAGAGRRRP